MMTATICEKNHCQHDLLHGGETFSGHRIETFDSETKTPRETSVIVRRSKSLRTYYIEVAVASSGVFVVILESKGHKISISKK